MIGRGLPWAALAVCLSVTAAQSEMLPGSEWTPLTVNGEAFVSGADVFLRFEQDARYVGHGGCNGFRGAFVTNGDAILFGPAAVTRMMCPETVSGPENTFLLSLNAVRGFTRDGMKLSLLDAGGTEVMTLQQRDAD